MGGTQSTPQPTLPMPKKVTGEAEKARKANLTLADASLQIDRAGKEILRAREEIERLRQSEEQLRQSEEQLRQSEGRYKSVAAEALVEANMAKKESETLRERQMWGLGAMGVLGVGIVASAGVAVAARRSKETALEAARLSLAEARRRAALDVENANKFGVSKFAKDLLEVADNLSRAAASVPEELRASDKQPALKALYDGVVMTDTVLLRSMEKHGLKRVEPMGEKFDPNFHDAVFTAPDPALEPGTVMHVATPGYVLHERCLRPAGVGVVAKADDVDPRSETNPAQE